MTPANIRTRFKKGEVANPSGKNGWTAARARTAAALERDADSMVAALVKLALAGDVAALRLALGPFLPTVKQDVIAHAVGRHEVGDAISMIVAC